MLNMRCVSKPKVCLTVRRSVVACHQMKVFPGLGFVWYVLSCASEDSCAGQNWYYAHQTFLSSVWEWGKLDVRTPEQNMMSQTSYVQSRA